MDARYGQACRLLRWLASYSITAALHLPMKPLFLYSVPQRLPSHSKRGRKRGEWGREFLPTSSVSSHFSHTHHAYFTLCPGSSVFRCSEVCPLGTVEKTCLISAQEGRAPALITPDFILMSSSHVRDMASLEKLGKGLHLKQDWLNLNCSEAFLNACGITLNRKLECEFFCTSFRKMRPLNCLCPSFNSLGGWMSPCLEKLASDTWVITSQVIWQNSFSCKK